MRKAIVATCLAAICIFLTTMTVCADDNQIKWSQASWDVNGCNWLSDCTVNTLMADDFACGDDDPITAVRWWGSYDGETEVRPEGGGIFNIAFYLSTDTNPFNIPYSLVYLQQVPAIEVFEGFDSQGSPVYRYDGYIPLFDQRTFSQQSPNIGELFLSIDKPTQENWGWRDVASSQPILSFAATGYRHDGSWITLGEPNMAFELMTVPEPGTLVLFAGGLLGLSGFALKKRIKK